MLLRYALSIFLPFRRLLLITFCPDFVLMRSRKPWVLLRFKMLGWNVCFKVVSLYA